MRIIAAPVILFALTAALAPAFAQAPRGAPDNSAAVAGRVERLEEQLAHLQSVVAAVETLAKTNGGGTGYAAAAGGGASADQVRQLSAQMADLAQRLQRLEARFGENTSPSSEPRQQTGFNTVAPASGFEDKEQLPPLNAPQAQSERYPFNAPPQQSANAGQAFSQQRLNSGEPSAPAPQPVRPAATAAAAPLPARALFDQALAALNRREYGASETYFQQFLDEYPNDALAGSAQYWFGEAAFASGEYRHAADRFLKTFTNFPNYERAPEALLKLAISLRRLGETAAACDSFAELQRRFPQGPKTVLQRADVEKKRANCT